jgi:hypothetical protein
LNAVPGNAGWRRWPPQLLGIGPVKPVCLFMGNGAGVSAQVAHQARLLKKSIDLSQIRRLEVASGGGTGAGGRPHLVRFYPQGD